MKFSKHTSLCSLCHYVLFIGLFQCVVTVTQEEKNSVFVPMYGEVTLPPRQAPNESQKLALADSQLGPLTITKAKVQRKNTKVTTTFLVTFAGTTLQAEHERDEKKPLESVIAFTLTSTDGSPIAILGVSLDQARLLYREKERDVTISGILKFMGLAFNAGFYINYGKEAEALFFATLSPDIKSWKPFAGSGIAQLEAVELIDLKAGIKAGVKAEFVTATLEGVREGADVKKASQEAGGLLASLFIAGSSTILNVKSNVVVDVGYEKGSGYGLTALAVLPKGWKLSQSFPELFTEQNPVTQAFDQLKISKALVALSTRDTKVYYNNEIEEVEQGVTLAMTIGLEDKYSNVVLEAVNKIVRGVTPQALLFKEGSKTPSLKLKGKITPQIKNMKLAVGISAGDFGFPLGPTKLYGGQLSLTLKGEPSIGFEGSFKFKPTDKDQPLTCLLDLSFSPHKFGLAGSIAGVWKNPFGIPGFEFGNLGLRGTQTYSAVVEALSAAAATMGVGALVGLIPADAGVAGQVKLGTGPDAIFANLRMNIGKDITSLGVIAELVNPITLPRLLELLLKQMGAPVTIVNAIPFNLRNVKLQFVPMGTTIGGIVLEQGVGFSSCADIFGKEACFETGLDWNRGAFIKGTMQPFSIGALNVTGANGQGSPIIHAELGPKAQTFKISGQITLADVLKSNTDISLSPTGATFSLLSAFGPPNAQISAQVQGVSKTAGTDLTALLKPSEVGLEIEFKNDLTNLLNAEIEKYINERKAIFERDLNDVITQVARRASQDDIKRQSDAVEYAKSRRVWFKDNPVLSIEREAEVQKEEAKLLALKIKYDLEKTALGDFLRGVFETLGLHRLFEQALQGVRNAGVGAFEAGRFVFNKIANAAIVKRVYWKGTLADISDGIVPGVEVEIEFSGKTVTQKIGNFNLKDPAASVVQIAQHAANIAIEGLKATLNIPSAVQPFKPVKMPEGTGPCYDLMFHEEYWINPDGTVRTYPGYDIREKDKHLRLAGECAETKQACSTYKRLQDLYGTGQWPISVKSSLERACNIEQSIERAHKNAQELAARP